MSAASALTIRQERPEDAAAVREILDAAFGGTAEFRLVDELRAGGHLVLALVAVQGETAVGYIAWPRLSIETPEGSSPAAGLAPLAVAPDRQRGGIGAQLMRAGLDRLRSRGETIAFVLGDPAYYARFGFSVESASRYDSNYAGEHFMALELASGAPQRGRVHYPAPFDSLG